MWPSPSAKTLATDLNEKYETVKKWKTRNRIPPNSWFGVVDAAERRRIRITVGGRRIKLSLELLADRKAAA